MASVVDSTLIDMSKAFQRTPSHSLIDVEKCSMFLRTLLDSDLEKSANISTVSQVQQK